MALEVRVLGEPRLVVDGEDVRLPPRLTLLIALLTAGGEDGVDPGVLVEELYAGSPPPTAAAAVRVHLAKLRDALEPGRDRAVSTRIARSQQAWRLRLEVEEHDAALFAAETGQAHALLAQEQSGPALALLRQALARWHEPYAGVDGALFEPERARLRGLRRTAGADLVRALLAEADPEAALDEVARLREAEPWDEELALLHARATYARAGQERALAVLREFSRALGDELGLDPSPRLREAEEAVLRHDPAWAPTPRRRGPGPVTAPSRLIGRAALLEDLHRLLADGHSVLLQGEAGIGKTAVLRELHADGEVPTVSVSAAAASTPYALLRELLAAHGAVRDDPDWSAFRHHATDAAGPADLELLAEDLAERHLAGPIVLLVDDAEAVDAPSLGVLRRLGTHGARVVLARRPGLAVVQDWSPLPVVPLEVEPLTPAQTRQLVARLGPEVELDDDQIAAIGGVPLLAEYAVQSGMGLDGLGERLLAPLDTDSRAAARVLAVVGAPVPVPAASRLVGVDAVEDLLVSRVLRVQGDRVRLAHPRLEEALRRSLGLVGCTRALADALEGDWDVPALLLAGAVEEYGAALPGDLVARWALAAGRESLEGGDLDGADRLLARAAEATDDADLARLARTDRARALTAAGRIVDARLLLTPLMDDLRDRGRDEELARCLTDYTGLLRLEGGEMHVVERHARWLLSRDRLVPDQRVRVLDALARCSPDDELAGRTVELLSECDAAGSPYARLCALEARWRLSHYSGEVPTVRVQAAWEGVSLAEQLGDTELEVRLLRHLLDDLVALGFGDELGHRLARLDDLSRRHHHAQARWWVQVMGVDALLREGRTEEALASAREVHDRWSRVPAPVRANFLMLQTFVALFQSGDWDALAAGLRDVVQGPEQLWVPDLVPDSALLLCAVLSGNAGADRVRAQVDRVVAAPTGWRRTAELALAGRAAVAAGVAAPELRRVMVPREHCWVTFGPAVASLGPVATVLAGLADLEDDPGPASHWRSQSAVRCTAMAAPWWVDERRPPAAGAAPTGDPTRRD